MGGGGGGLVLFFIEQENHLAKTNLLLHKHADYL